VRRQKQAQLLDSWRIPHCALEELPANSSDVVIDCTGSPEAFSICVNLVKPRGKIVLKSTYEGQVSTDLTSVAVNEIQIIGSRCGPFEAALRTLDRGLVDVEALIDARYRIEDGAAAFNHASQPGILKVVLDMRLDA
jgi:threonine dehydrogenase-like Zn-dependent dehydrogenase